MRWAATALLGGYVPVSQKMEVLLPSGGGCSSFLSGRSPVVFCNLEPSSPAFTESQPYSMLDTGWSREQGRGEGIRSPVTSDFCSVENEQRMPPFGHCTGGLK